MGAILQNTPPDFSELNVGPTVRSARLVKQQSRLAKLHCSLDQPTQSGHFGFSIKFCHPAGIFMPKNKVLFYHTAIEHKMNMALQKLANSNAQYYVKMLCTTTKKTPPTSKFYVDFKNNFFKDQKTETHLPSSDILRLVW